MVIYMDFSGIYVKDVFFFFFIEGMKTDNFKIECFLEYFREEI